MLHFHLNMTLELQPSGKKSGVYCFYFKSQILQFPVWLSNSSELDGLSLKAVTESGMLQSTGVF